MKKTVVFGITGGIAAYKAADAARRLRKRGVDVYVIMTRHACEFITPLTLQSLTGREVVTDMFERPQRMDVEHIALAKRADAFVIAPATANIIAKMACGIADDMLSTTVMATTAPVLLAPAMNQNMYRNPATQKNLELLRERGVKFIGPEEGMLANGDMGIGRMSEPSEIEEVVLSMLHDVKDFAGKRVLVTAGPTREPIDPVRYVSNRSSGKMGYALAREAQARGAEVTLIAGPNALEKPYGVRFVGVETTAQMHDAVMEVYPDTDIVLKAAAPADYRVHAPSEEKIKKKRLDETLDLELETTPDILLALGENKTHQFLVGFAAETNDALENARAKLVAKHLDCMVLNDVSQRGAGFEVDTNIVTIMDEKGDITLPIMDKREVAGHILDYVAKRLNL
ncbi:MAG: bifunctional phosphopantothenoylcysteine decarboxylase/phosphopantothenate--cysteine ligase CoaBC [Christensenellales bacterium]|jgi:phosphopantothenoylcysteine decarboxylase/phosphopantothenate--cysteine ligase